MTSPEHPDAGGKCCTKCGEWKPWDGFHRRSKSLDGRQTKCKVCVCEYNEQNRDRNSEKQREWREKNREALLEKHRGYYYTNRNRLRELQREYQRSYHVRNRNKSTYKRNSVAKAHKRRARKLSLPFETVILREIALRDGATCWMCGDELSEWNPAHLDHLIPLAADADQLAAWNLDNPGTVRANMALACPSCNIRKSNRVMPCALARYFRNLSAESELRE